MTEAPAIACSPTPWPDQGAQCRIFPADQRFRTLLEDLLGEALQLRVGNPPDPRETVLVDCLDSHEAIASARLLYPRQPLVGVLPRHDAGLIISALAQGAAGVIALTDPPNAWRECVLVVMGGGRWLGGPGLEICLEEKRAVYDVARNDDLHGDVTMRTKLYVKQRVADKFRS